MTLISRNILPCLTLTLLELQTLNFFENSSEEAGSLIYKFQLLFRHDYDSRKKHFRSELGGVFYSLPNDLSVFVNASMSVDVDSKTSLPLYFTNSLIFLSTLSFDHFVLFRDLFIVLNFWSSSSQKTPKMAFFGQNQKNYLLQSFYYSRLLRKAFEGR